MLDMDEIDSGKVWQNRFIDLPHWIDDLDIMVVICRTIKWIRQFIDKDPEWN